MNALWTKVTLTHTIAIVPSSGVRSTWKLGYQGNGLYNPQSSRTCWLNICCVQKHVLWSARHHQCLSRSSVVCSSSRSTCHKVLGWKWGRLCFITMIRCHKCPSFHYIQLCLWLECNLILLTLNRVQALVICMINVLSVISVINVIAVRAIIPLTCVMSVVGVITDTSKHEL